MTNEEAALLLAKISRLYHGRLKADVETTRAWASMFRKDDAADVEAALESWMNKAGEGNFTNHPPNAVQIRAELKRNKDRTKKRKYFKADRTDYIAWYWKQDRVLATFRDSSGKLYMDWAHKKECVTHGNRHYRQIDFIAKWAPEFLSETCKIMFPHGDISKVFTLFEGAKEGKPESIKALDYWNKQKSLMLDVAIDNARAATGKQVIRTEELQNEATERMPYCEA